MVDRTIGRGADLDSGQIPQYLPTAPCRIRIEPVGITLKVLKGQWHRGDHWASCWRQEVTKLDP